MENPKLIIDELFEGLQELEDPDMLSTTEWKSLTMFAKNKEIFQSLQSLGIGDLATKETTTEANQCSVKWFQTATAGLEAEIEVITRNSEGKQCYCPGGGGVLPYMGYMGICRCEGYGFQAVYSGIGYINQSVWV